MSDSDLMRRQANAIYFEVDKGTADDVSASLRAGADAVDRLQRAEEVISDGSTLLTVKEMWKWQEKANAFLGERND